MVFGGEMLCACVWARLFHTHKLCRRTCIQRAHTHIHSHVHIKQVAKTNKRLDWCHNGEIPPVLLRIEEEERQAMKRLNKKTKTKSSLTEAQRRLR